MRIVEPGSPDVNSRFQCRSEQVPAGTVSDSEHGRRKGSLGLPWILKISTIKKGCFLSFEWEKTNFTTFGTPWKNPLVSPLEKILPMPMIRKILWLISLIRTIWTTIRLLLEMRKRVTNSRLTHLNPRYAWDALTQWFPTGGSRPQSGSRRSFCGVANSSLNSFLKSRIFRTSYINILLHQHNRNTDRSLWSSHYLRHNS